MKRDLIVSIKTTFEIRMHIFFINMIINDIKVQNKDIGYILVYTQKLAVSTEKM